MLQILPNILELYLSPPPNICHKIRTAIDFSQNFLSFNFYGLLKHDIRSARYVPRYFVKEGSHFPLLFENLLENKSKKKRVLSPKNPKT